METFNTILVVSRSTRLCIKVLRTGIALVRKRDAHFHVLHIINDPFSLNGWNLMIPSLDDEYKSMIGKAKVELDRLLGAEKAEGLVINERVKDGNPIDTFGRQLPAALMLVK